VIAVEGRKFYESRVKLELVDPVTGNKTVETGTDAFDSVKLDGPLSRYNLEATGENDGFIRLSSCCATVHSFFTCLGDKKEAISADTAGL